MIGIYIIKCLQENKVYIGSSKDIIARWNQHKARLNKGNHINKYLQLDWDCYGDDSFIFEILEETADLIQREQHWIDKYSDCLYNVSKNAWTPMRSPEVVKKVLATKMKKYGRISQNQKLTDEIVIEIIKDFNEGVKIDKHLAAKYKVARKTLYNIKIGHTWKHLYHLILDKRTADEIKEESMRKAKELRAIGLSRGAIAKELGVSNITIYNWGLE